MKKKILSRLLLLAAGFMLLSSSAYADIGPKPSTHVTFEGGGGRVYYVTLLSAEKSTGPFSVGTGPINRDELYDSGHIEEDLIAWQAFRDYEDGDGFYFLENFGRSNDQGTFSWTYYPPGTFKVLVFFPEDGGFFSTGILERYAFDSYFKVTFSTGQVELSAVKSYDFSAEAVSFAARVVLTLAAETAIALLFGLRKKNILLFVFAVNAATQVLLNVLLNVFNYRSGGFAFVFNYVWMELLIIAIEAVVFSAYFKKAGWEKPIKRWVAPVYSLTANSASFVAGLLISLFLPGVF